MAFFCSPAISLNPSVSFNFIKSTSPHLLIITNSKKIFKLQPNPLLLQCKTIRASALASETESDYETEEVYTSTEEYSDEDEEKGPTPPPVKRRRRRYRKQYPGEANGITEEMRFVAMKLRNNGKPKSRRASAVGSESNGEERAIEKQNDDGIGETWQPSIEGLLKYFVDSKLIFSTIERIVDDSTDVSCELLVYYEYNYSILFILVFLSNLSYKVA